MKVALRLMSNGKIVSGWDTGVLTADRDSIGIGETFELITLDGPPDPPPTPTGADEIDFTNVAITRESPDVRRWAITANLSSLKLYADRDAELDFTKRTGAGAWPFVTNMEGGEIQYTLWVGCYINSIWYFAACIECISRSPSDNYVPTGPTLQPGQLPNNWYYFTGSPLATYQPAPGEKVAWLLTAGAQRRDDIHIVAERSQVIVRPFE
jgi:hypothetical protein